MRWLGWAPSSRPDVLTRRGGWDGRTPGMRVHGQMTRGQKMAVHSQRQRPREKRNLPISSSWTPGLQHCGKVNCVSPLPGVLSHGGLSILSQQQNTDLSPLLPRQRSERKETETDRWPSCLMLRTLKEGISTQSGSLPHVPAATVGKHGPAKGREGDTARCG